MVAERTSVPHAMLWAAATLIAGLASMIPYRLKLDEEIDLAPALHWPEPKTLTPPPPEAGPVLVTVEYLIDPARARDFITAMQALKELRRRDGAYRWGLFSDPTNPKRFLETFVVETWAEHMRQHERVTMADREIEDMARRFHTGKNPPVVSHLVYAGEEAE
jgi:quinol monooxygenase YgiN